MSQSVYRVKMSRIGAGGWVKEGDLTGNQEQNAAKLDNRTDNAYTDRMITRLKTDDGTVSAIIRNSQGVEHVVHATPGAPGLFKFENGETYQLEVTEVRGPTKPTAVDLTTATFVPPTVSIERKTVNNQDGVQVTFEPTTTPGIFTVAPEGAAKPLGIPSFPFPAQFPDQQARTKVSCFIPIVDIEPPTQNGEGPPFLLKSHTHLRVGVRGTGLFVRGIKIPAVGGRTKIVKPEKFLFVAAQVDNKWIAPNTVAAKHGEKANILQYT